MVHNTELLQYSAELIKLAITRNDLANKLITQTADLQSFESELFKLCLLDFSDDVVFLKDKSTLLEKAYDELYCEEVHSVISNGMITFYDYNEEAIIKLVLNPQYEDCEVCD